MMDEEKVSGTFLANVETQKTDQNATIRTFDFDKLGRQTTDIVDTISSGSAVDSTVRRIDRTYNSHGLPELATSYSSVSGGSTNVLNQIQHEYNDFGQLEIEYQQTDGEVATSTSPKVQYAYNTGSSDSGATANSVRLKKITYPNLKELDYGYGSGGDDDKLSRVLNLTFDAVEVAKYTRLGLGDIIKTDYTEPDVRQEFAFGATNFNPDDGLDYFGRVKELRWEDYGASATHVKLKHGYDTASNRLWRENTKATTHSQLYAYDELNRLQSFKQGTLSTTSTTNDTVSSPTQEQTWTLDATGNWGDFDQQTLALNQVRTHNVANEITGITEDATDLAWDTPMHDANGNMTTMPKPATLTAGFDAKYDAWNRLAKITETTGGNTVAEYRYDGLGRRIVKKSYISGTLDETRDFYYSNSWQVLEEQIGTSTPTVDRQFVWGIRYIDDLILRDRTTTTTLDERLYALQDANWNVAAVVGDDSGWKVLQRYEYDPYGSMAKLTATFGTSSTDYEWEYTFTGRRLDDETGLMYYRARYYHAELGRFINRDPIGYGGGINLHAYVSGSPLSNVDPSGLWTKWADAGRWSYRVHTPQHQTEGNLEVMEYMLSFEWKCNSRFEAKTRNWNIKGDADWLDSTGLSLLIVGITTTHTAEYSHDPTARNGHGWWDRHAKSGTRGK